jgi:hypothetical protein
VIKSTAVEKIREEGREEGRQATLLRFLASRTRQTVPEDLAALIRDCHDGQRLDSWVDIAAQVETLEQFRQQAAL